MSFVMKPLKTQKDMQEWLAQKTIHSIKNVLTGAEKDTINSFTIQFEDGSVIHISAPNQNGTRDRLMIYGASK